MLIGIAGYLVPGDNYQLILPEVSSWTIDKRNKSQRKNNYQGGFSTSLTKYDESKFISISWDVMSEQDLGLVTGYTNYIEPFGVTTTSVQVNTTDYNTVSINNFMSAIIPDNGIVYAVKGNNLIELTTQYSEEDVLYVKSNSTLTLDAGTKLVLYNKPLAGLLSLASLSATGQTHVLRDFTGKLVKVVLNSPKYEALGGSDNKGQLYFNTRMDMDVVADINSYAYTTVTATKGSVYNERLPSQGSILSTPPTADPTTLYLQSDNSLGYISLQTPDTYAHTITSLIAYKLRYNSIGSYGNILSKQLILFKNTITADSQVPMNIIAGTTTIYSATDAKATLTLPSLPDFVLLGSWSPTIEYARGKFLEIKTSSYVVPKGVLITYKDNGKDYLSLIDKNSEPFTNLEAWAPLEGKPWYVNYNGKLYMVANQTASNTLGQEPGNSTAWTLVNMPAGDITLKITAPLLEEVVNSALYLVVAPMILQTNTSPSTDYMSTNLIRIPVLQERFTFDIQLSASEYCIKTASTVFDKDGITCTMQDTTATSPYPSNVEYVTYPALMINAAVIKANTASSTSVSSDSYGFNLDLLNSDKDFILNSLWVVNNDPGVAKMSHGTPLLNITDNKGYVNYQDGLVSKRKEFTNFTSVTTTSSEVLQTFNVIDLTKSVYDVRYDHKLNQFQIIIYSLSLPNDYKQVIATETGKFDPNLSGYKVTKTKTVYTSTTSTITSNTNQLYQANYQSHPSRVSLSNAHTYITKPISAKLVNNIFGLEGDTWA